jgi:hypothetical protein
MCQNIEKTVLNLMVAEEPEVKAILSIAGVVDTPAATAALNAYNEAITDLETWTPGTASQEAIELIEDAETAFDALPIPTTDKVLVDAVIAVFITAIGLISGNTAVPTPTTLPEGVTAADVQVNHQQATMTTYFARAQARVPFYRIKTRATWLPERTVGAQAKACWNKACDLADAPGFKV